MAVNGHAHCFVHVPVSDCRRNSDPLSWLPPSQLFSRKSCGPLPGSRPPLEPGAPVGSQPIAKVQLWADTRAQSVSVSLMIGGWPGVVQVLRLGVTIRVGPRATAWGRTLAALASHWQAGPGTQPAPKACRKCCVKCKMKCSHLKSTPSQRKL